MGSAAPAKGLAHLLRLGEWDGSGSDRITSPVVLEMKWRLRLQNGAWR
jgi:hypothetical protein